MKISNGVPPVREFNVKSAEMEYAQESYTYNKVPVEDDVMTYYVKGVPPSDAI